MTICTRTGLSVEDAIHKILERAVHILQTESGRLMANSMSDDVKQHISNRYPGSTHYNPDKVQIQGRLGNYADVDIDIPGISKAYHDIDIYPRNAKYLTIPLHSSAYGKRATEFNDLFKPKGKNILARIENGALVAMYALSKHVHQRMDTTLMPSDDTLSKNITDKISHRLDSELRNIINTL